MKKVTINQGVTYHNGKEGPRSFSSRKVLKIYTANSGERVSYMQVAGPFKGSEASLSLTSFVRWAKGEIDSDLPQAIKATEQPSHKVTEADAFGNDCPNNSCS